MNTILTAEDAQRAAELLQDVAQELLSDSETRAQYDSLLPAQPALGDDPLLDPIKRLIANKSRQEVIHVRDDTAMHVRSLSAAWGPEWSKQPYHINAEAARLARHQKELAFLDTLLALDMEQFEQQVRA